MKIIKEISEMIEDELGGGKHYIEKALHCKDENPALARVFYEISLQEMNHVNMLHGEVTKIIERHRKEHGEPPAPMMAVYDYLHEKHIDKANRIKVYQAQYRGE